jgi:hypothetical protein
MKAKYDKTQYGLFMMLMPIPFITLLCLAYFLRWGEEPLSPQLFYILLAVFIFLSLLFYKLRIRVHENGMLLTYGIGIICIPLSFDRIDSLSKEKIPFIKSLGIRITRTGYLFAVEGKEVVRINYTKAGKQKSLRIGSKDRDNLIAVLENQFKNK